MLCLSLSTHSSLRLSPLLHISTLHTHFLSLPTSSLHPLPLSTRFLSPPTWSDSALPPRCAHAFIHMILACSGCVLPTPEPTHKKQKCAYLWVTSIVATASRALNPLSKPSLMCTIHTYGVDSASAWRVHAAVGALFAFTCRTFYRH